MNPEDVTVIQPSGDGTEIRVTLARFEAKLDVALAQHGAKIESHEKEITSLREADKEHSLRLLTLERTSSVTPKQLGATVLAVCASLGAMAPFIDRLYS